MPLLEPLPVLEPLAPAPPVLEDSRTSETVTSGAPWLAGKVTIATPNPFSMPEDAPIPLVLEPDEEPLRPEDDEPLRPDEDEPLRPDEEEPLRPDEEEPLRPDELD